MNKVVECVRAWATLEEGELFIVAKEYWYNGEGWYKLRDTSGKTYDYPSIFFDDFIPSADPARAAYYEEPTQ